MDALTLDDVPFETLIIDSLTRMEHHDRRFDDLGFADALLAAEAKGLLHGEVRMLAAMMIAEAITRHEEFESALLTIDGLRSIQQTSSPAERQTLRSSAVPSLTTRRRKP